VGVAWRSPGPVHAHISGSWCAVRRERRRNAEAEQTRETEGKICMLALQRGATQRSRAQGWAGSVCRRAGDRLQRVAEADHVA
jgi:hypothetical protein